MSAEVAPADETTRERSGNGNSGGKYCGNVVGHLHVEVRPCVCRTGGDGCLGCLASIVLLPLVCVTGALWVRFWECSCFSLTNRQGRP
jgi:hypothetical protein